MAEVKDLPIPLFGSIVSNRSGDETDDVGLRQAFINVFFEKTTNTESGKQEVKCIARPGVTACDSAGDIASANAQGIYFWPQTQFVYAVVNKVIYKKDCSAGFNSASSFTSTGVSVTSIAGVRLWFDEFYDGTNYYLMIKGNELDRFSTADVLTNVADGDFTGLTARGPTVNADGFIFAMADDGRIGNSDVNAPTAWTAGATLFGQYPDKGIGMARTDQYIIGLRAYSTEFYVNAGNAAGSVLSRVSNLTRPIGCLSANTIKRQDEDIYFVGRTRESGFGVYRIRGGAVEKISTPAVDRYLKMSSEICWADLLPMEGHTFYVISPFISGHAAPYSLVFDINENQWLLWSTVQQSTIKTLGFGPSFVAHVRPAFLQEIIVIMAPQDTFGGTNASNTNFAFYKPVKGASQVYTDGGASFPITYRLQTDELDFDSNFRKSNPYVQLSATKGSGTITLSVCDDGSGTFRTLNTFDMSSDMMKVTQCGQFRKRMYRLQWTSSFQVLRSMHAGISVGTS